VEGAGERAALFVVDADVMEVGGGVCGWIALAIWRWVDISWFIVAFDTTDLGSLLRY
jgi:hypothetical protein